MAQTGYTPISIYYSATATNTPTAGNLVAGELAINTADGKLFYKDSSGVVQTMASKATAALPTTTTGSGAIVLATSPTITTPIVATTISVGGATPSASGSGVSFPATQSASSDANTLDDYEEGTWTPTDASGAGLTLTITYASYTKIGNTVRLSAFITYPATASGASALLGGLPFSSSQYAIGAVRSTVACVATALDTNIYINNPLNTAITNVQLTSSFFIFTVVYKV